MSWKNGMLAVLCASFLAVAFVLVNREPVQGQQKQNNGLFPAHYSVVETQGHNLLVTDNHTNTLYFYTVEKDEKVGADLKLRASIDLTQVGKPEIKIKASK